MTGSVEFKQGAVIYFEGDPSGPLYILRSGRIALSRDAVGSPRGTELGPGDLLGVAEALANHPRIATARAITDCVCLALLPTDLAMQIASNVDVGLKIVTSLSRELREIDDVIVRRLHLDEGGEDAQRRSLRAVGDHFAKLGMYRAARYAVGKYLEADPPDRADYLETGLKLVGICESDGEVGVGADLAEFLAAEFPGDPRPTQAAERLRKIQAVLE